MTGRNVNAEIVWKLGLFIFLGIALNSDFNTRGLLWWGSVAILLISYVISTGGRISIDFNTYDSWFIIFMIVALMTTVVATSIGTVLNMIKTLLVTFVVMYFIGKKIKSEEDIKNTLLYIGVCNSMGVFVYSD